MLRLGVIEPCGRNRVARLMRQQGLRSQTGYRRRPGRYGGKPPVASPNNLERKFNVTEPNKVWVTDITYHEHEGHGPLREWMLEAGLSNQWLARVMNISDIASGLT